MSVPPSPYRPAGYRKNELTVHLEAMLQESNNQSNNQSNDAFSWFSPLSSTDTSPVFRSINQTNNQSSDQSNNRLDSFLASDSILPNNQFNQSIDQSIVYQRSPFLPPFHRTNNQSNNQSINRTNLENTFRVPQARTPSKYDTSGHFINQTIKQTINSSNNQSNDQPLDEPQSPPPSAKKVLQTPSTPSRSAIKSNHPALTEQTLFIVKGSNNPTFNRLIDSINQSNDQMRSRRGVRRRALFEDHSCKRVKIDDENFASASRPIDQTNDQPNDQSNKRSNDQSNDQIVDQIVDQSINQTIDQSNARVISKSDFTVIEEIGRGSYCKVLKVKVDEILNNQSNNQSINHRESFALSIALQEYKLPGEIQMTDCQVTYFKRINDYTLQLNDPQANKASNNESKEESKTESINQSNNQSIKQTNNQSNNQTNNQKNKALCWPAELLVPFAVWRCDGVNHMLTPLFEGDIRRLMNRSTNQPLNHPPNYFSDKLAAPLIDLIDCWQILLDVGNALKHLSINGLLHMDVKPDNILYETINQSINQTINQSFTSKKRFILADFGCLMDVECGPWTDGTGAYIAPEALQDSMALTSAADVFGLGATLYTIMTGQTVKRSSNFNLSMDPTLYWVSTQHAYLPGWVDEVKVPPIEHSFDPLITIMLPNDSQSFKQTIKQSHNQPINQTIKSWFFKLKSLVTRMVCQNPKQRPSLDEIVTTAIEAINESNDQSLNQTIEKQVIKWS